MTTLRQLIDSNSRIKHDQLVSWISDTPYSTFIDQATFPFLVGKELYEGEIRKRAKTNSVSESTMMFKPAINTMASNIATHDDSKAPPATPSGISHAIYAVRRKPFSASEKNIISIGRNRDNDIVIADYVISKYHAQIITFHDMFFIVDLNSTNGTQVNRQKVKSNIKLQLEMNSTVSFGRLVFFFTSPMMLYKGLQRENFKLQN